MFTLQKQFETAINSAIPQHPSIPSKDVLALRKTLITEEFKEVIIELEAEQTDLPNLAQELADLLYVTLGTFVAIGVDADAVFAEVHRANMQKVSGPRRADGKIMKPEGFKKADVASVIESLKPRVSLEEWYKKQQDQWVDGGSQREE
jgi:predicted HAD superfamily Cof-like phosphohydrolase